jgi:hypothetical protein
MYFSIIGSTIALQHINNMYEIHMNDIKYYNTKLFLFICRVGSSQTSYHVALFTICHADHAKIVPLRNHMHASYSWNLISKLKPFIRILTLYL